MPDTLKEEPVNYIVNLFNAVKNWRDAQETRWQRYYKLYRNYRDNTGQPFKSNIFVPYIFSIVESVVPKMLGTIFNTRPIISVVPRKGSSEDLSKLLERLLEYQLDEDQLEFFTKILEFFKECAIYGSSFAKIIPRFNEDEMVSFNFVDIEPIDIFNVFPDYRAKSIRRMKYIMQLSYVDYDELESGGRAGFYKNVPELLGQLESMAVVDDYKKKRLTSVGILDEYGWDANRKIVEVIEYWDKDNIITIGARKELLKKEKNPFGGLLPFIMARYIPVQHELYGIGIPEISESLQEELNTVRNQRMDNVNLVINRMFIANKYADIDLDSLISYPGNVILTNDINAIKALDTRDVTKSAYAEEEIIKRDIDNCTGEWEYGRGAPPQRRETATGIVRLQQASNIRFDTVVKMLEFTVLRNIAKMFLWLDYNFLSPKDFAKIVGEEEFIQLGGMQFYGSDIEDILKQYHFQPMGSSTTAVKEVRVQQVMQAFQLFNQDPSINQMELRKMVLDVLDIKNVNRLLQTPQMTLQTPEASGAPGVGGAQPPPMPPQPGMGTVPENRALSELMSIAGGSMVKGPGGTLNVGTGGAQK